MTPAPRVTHAVRAKTKACMPYLGSAHRALRNTARGMTDPYLTNRKLIYLGTGLALAGAGAGTLTGITGPVSASASTTASGHGTVAVRPVSPRNLRATGGQSAVPAAAHVVRADGSRVRHAPHVRTWLTIERIAADHTVPRAGSGPLPAQDRLTPTGTSGPQSWLPMTPERYANASTIVHQALDKKMGLRSAVIAVATAMQESTLLNINHGDRDSLGLFQQRPSAGWGGPSQLLRPAFAADAFLGALHTYQAHDPAWVRQPLWQDAQDVQKSGVPYAYAKWEAQAAHIVSTVTHSIY
ncbi:MAG TPA: hypothetical protein VFQ44_30645 [Streptosporangiaceae bacterium]|nr:hypothetical protein [Streptosporangiaceae bacterium]